MTTLTIRMSVVKFLVNKGVDFSFRDHEALRLAAKYRNKKIVQYLERRGSDISAIKRSAFYF